MRPYYESDGVTIYRGDCRELIALLEPVDLVLTDPPYGVGYAEWDSVVLDPQSWLPDCIRHAPSVMVTPGNANQWDYPRPDWTAAWFRPGSVVRSRGGGFSHWEPVLIYGENRLPYDARSIKNTLQGIDWHPCAKPLDLFKWFISECSPLNGLVLDPFMGSATTLVAAKETGRRAIGIEIDEDYCRQAAERLEATQRPFLVPEPDERQEVLL